MLNEMNVFKEIPGFYKIIPLNVFRNTPGVTFDNVPTQALPRIDAIDRVIHESSAKYEPGGLGDVQNAPVKTGMKEEVRFKRQVL